MLDLIRKYLDNRLQLAKIELINILANVTAGLISSFLTLVMATFIILLFSLALAFWMGDIFNNTAIGFVIVAGIYLLIFVIYLMFSKEHIDTKVKDKIVRMAFKIDDDLKEDYVEFEEEE